PPGGNGTIMVMGLSGNAAMAGRAPIQPSRAMAANRVFADLRMGLSPLRFEYVTRPCCRSARVCGHTIDEYVFDTYGLQRGFFPVGPVCDSISVEDDDIGLGAGRQDSASGQPECPGGK